MAMTVRLPEDLDARLDALAREQHISKHALIVAATDRYVRAEAKTARVLDAVDEIGAEYAEAIERLAAT